MLHPVNSPQCIEVLELILLIQDRLLEISLIQNPGVINILNSNFNVDTASWLWRYQDKLVNPLEEYYSLPDQNEKTDLLAAFRHDITFHEHIDDPNFTFHLQPEQNLPNANSSIIGNWLQNYYDVLMRWGIPAGVIGIEFDVLSQRIYWEFDSANESLRVCPGCDGTWMEKTSTGILSTLDHFFPRSKYPALSIHPSNLIPLCEMCNNKIKENKDPLTDNQLRTLPDTYHSYYRPGIHQLVLDTDVAHLWVFTGNPKLTAAQTSLFPDIIDIPGRWESRVDEIDRMVRRRLKSLIELAINFVGEITQDDLTRILDRLFAELRKEWGESNFAYPATFWLDWLRKNKLQELRAEFVTV